MPCGVCKLCRQEKDLLDSHLIPAGIIRQLREPSLGNPNPILVTGKVVVQSPRPIKDYVLCRDCEDLFSKKGEAWVIGHMARDDKFLVYDALKKSKPIAADHEIAVYAGSLIPEIDVDKLVYFALSVFWRSAVHRWRGFSGLLPRIELGPYEEPIRKFLLGNGPFPAHTVLLVAVWPTRDAYQGTHTPRRGRETRFHTFAFYIPAIELPLCVGKGIPPEARKMCAYQDGPQAPAELAQGCCSSCGTGIPGQWDPVFRGQITARPFVPRTRSRSDLVC